MIKHFDMLFIVVRFYFHLSKVVRAKLVIAKSVYVPSVNDAYADQYVHYNFAVVVHFNICRTGETNNQFDSLPYQT